MHISHEDVNTTVELKRISASSACAIDLNAPLSGNIISPCRYLTLRSRDSGLSRPDYMQYIFSFRIELTCRIRKRLVSLSSTKSASQAYTVLMIIIKMVINVVPG